MKTYGSIKDTWPEAGSAPARMSSRTVFAGIVLLGLALALAFRLPLLDSRPMHGDEANQAVRTGGLMEEGVYHYDPHDHHGPVLYYAALPFCRATAKSFADTTETCFRLVPVAFAVLTLLFMALLFRSASPLLPALFLFAVSPAFCFYNRFFIQESLLVCFLTGMLASAVCWTRACAAGRRRVRVFSAVCFGVFAGLTMATKETFVLSFAAAGLALFVCLVPKKSRPSREFLLCASASLGVAVFVAGVVAVLFYSSFFTYWQGVYDALFSTVSTYAHRAVDVQEHQHPWWFYLQTVFGFRYGRGPIFSEALLFPFAAVAAFRAFFSRKPNFLVRFLSVYTVSLTVVYCLIPYKTPWCSLTFLHGWILLAACGWGGLWTDAKNRRAVRAVLLLALCGTLVWHGRQAVKACFTYPADPRNPYVYAHTGTDCLRLTAAIDKAAGQADGFHTRIAFAVPPSDTWPLPWYLRKYTNVGYWTKVSEIPDAVRPVILVVSGDQGDVAAERFGKGKDASFYGVRPGILVNLFTPKEKE